nr:MAG TPA: hypothetical protein [Caudoviricetes sp.]
MHCGANVVQFSSLKCDQTCNIFKVFVAFSISVCYNIRVVRNET